MAKLLKLRRGSTTQHASFTGAEGEVTIDTTKDTAVVHDGAQAGGRPLLREDMSNLPAGTIDNADINASAAISGTKISPDFGSQNITTTGTTNLNGDLTLGGNRPRLNFYDANNNPDLAFINDSGMFQVFDQTNGVNRIQINTNGHVDVLNHLDVNNGLDVTGDITATGTFSSGSGSDQLNITHSGGGASHIAATGDLLLKGTDNVYIGGVNNETHIKCTEDGPVELYHNGTKKAETRSNGFRVFDNLDVDAGVDVTGNITCTGTIDGRDVASDGSKLDTYEANGSSYVRSDADDTASGSYSFTNSYNEFGDGTGSVSNDGGWNARVNIAGSNHGRLDVKSVSDGIIATMSAHNGHGKAYMGTRSSGHSLGLYSGGSERATLSTAGSLSTTVQGTLWGASNDGSGSGLDADTVDGKHKTDFLQKGTSNSSSHYNGDSWLEFSSNYGLYYPNNYAYHVYLDSNYLKLTNNTNTNGIAIFTNSSSRRGYVYADNGNNIGFLNTGGSWSLKCDNSGNVTATGNVTAYSDARLKTNVNTINDALSIVGKLRGVSFDWKESGERSIGVIAQEVEEVLPELVLTQEVTDGKTEDNPNPETKEIKSVDYGKIVGVLINAINELKAEVDELKGGK